MQLPKLEQFKYQELPLLSPCYCGKCKRPLTRDRVVDDDNAWCPSCSQVVTTSVFQVPSWTIGVTTVLLMVVLEM
jgi:hypothetical protein